MIRGDGVVEDLQLVSLPGLKKPIDPILPVTGKFDEKLQLTECWNCPYPAVRSKTSSARSKKKGKVEAYLFIRESLNFLRQRSTWEFFNGLL
ncbi:hypothetical protein [Desulfonatronum lacustre]|uniref:hypothetical protein n=1 Tax=Desulfonatronum lacustre TaxID=66849 RepID=UPI0012ECA90A|nr:hypothetical protein [Desulfonatronum lacustre]